MLSLGSGCRNVSSAIVSSVIREIEIWRVAVLMVPIATPTRPRRIASCVPRSEQRKGITLGGYLASRHNRDRAAYRHDGTTELIMLWSKARVDPYKCHGRSPGNGSVQAGGGRGSSREGSFELLGIDWYRDGENIQKSPITTTESKPSWTHPETGCRYPRKTWGKDKAPKYVEHRPL